MKIGTNDISKIYLGGSEISKIMLGTNQVYSGGSEPTPVPYSGQYLTIESTSNNNTISLVASNTAITKTVSASTDNGSTWTEYTSSTGGTQIASLNTGDKVLVKGENAAYAESWISKTIFASTSSFIVYGNIMSLLYGDNFSGQTALTSANTFSSLFSQCSGLTSAENLIMPATTLANECYVSMFEGCTSLTTAPELPATTLAYSCYSSMFSECTSLTTAPELPATILAESCYEHIFNGCTNLSSITCIATDISADMCTNGWVDGVASHGTFTKAASMSSWGRGTSGIPRGWTVQNAD